MKIVIRHNSNTPYIFDVDPDDRVRYLKGKINQQLGIPLDEQKITYRGQILDDDETFDYYSIEEDSVLHLRNLSSSRNYSSSKKARNTRHQYNFKAVFQESCFTSYGNRHSYRMTQLKFEPLEDSSDNRDFSFTAPIWNQLKFQNPTPSLMSNDSNTNQYNNQTYYGSNSSDFSFPRLLALDLDKIWD